MFNRGDIVKVRKDLTTGNYGADGANYLMVERYAGKYAVVTSTFYKSGELCYRLDIDHGDWTWTLGMLIRTPHLSPFCEWESKYVLTSVTESATV